MGMGMGLVTAMVMMTVMMMVIRMVALVVLIIGMNDDASLPPIFVSGPTFILLIYGFVYVSTFIYAYITVHMYNNIYV